jgi:hypothetical protein
MSQRPCEVCGQVADVTVCSSAVCAMSFAFCDACMVANVEPWGALMSEAVICSETTEWFNQIVKRTCARLGKPEQEFWDAARRAREMFYEQADE